MKNQLQELIQITKNDPEKHFVLQDGRIVFNGQVFRDQQQLKLYFKTSKQALNFFDKIKKLKFWK